MKKIYVIVSTVLVSTFAIARGPGNGSTPTGLAVVKKNETTFNLYYQPAGLSNVKVSIFNADGKEVFAESIKKTNGFVRPYNLSSLTKGDYTIKVVDGNKTHTQKFIYGSVDRPKAANVVQLTDSRYLLAVKGSLISGKVHIKIFDGLRMIHEQRNEISGDFGQVFRIHAVDPSGVSFEVTDSKGVRIN